MKRWTNGIAALIAMVVLMVGGAMPAQGSIQIDFQPSGSVTQSGFTAITSTAPTIVGGVTFDVSGAFFDRGDFTNDGLFTFKNLLDDFAYSNASGGATTAPALTLTMTGLLPSTPYDMRFYSGDFFTPAGGTWADDLTTTYTPTVGTGSAFASTFDRTTNPTTNNQYSTLGTITSDASGKITMSIVGSSVSGQAFTRLNALTLAPIPEPSTFLVWSLLIGLTWAGGAWRYARRRR